MLMYSQNKGGNMPDKPNSNNRSVTLRLPRELYYRIKQRADACGMDVSAYIRTVLNEDTRNVVLTYDDIMTIAQEVRDAESKYNY